VKPFADLTIMPFNLLVHTDTFSLFGIQIFCLGAYMTKVIPETRFHSSS